MVQESGSDAFCIAEKLKPRSAIKGTLRGVRGGVKSPYSIWETISLTFVLSYWHLRCFGAYQCAENAGECIGLLRGYEEDCFHRHGERLVEYSGKG